MTTWSYPPESSTTTSPPVIVCDIACVKVRHGADCEQGPVSIPTVETKVRGACPRILTAAANSSIGGITMCRIPIMGFPYPELSQLPRPSFVFMRGHCAWAKAFRMKPGLIEFHI